MSPAKEKSVPKTNAAREEEAKRKFQMISPNEAKARMIIGAGLACLGVPLALKATPPSDQLESGLAWLFITAGIMLIRMGQLSQCGCILGGKWNPDGVCYRPGPSQSFINLKRWEFLLNMVQSILAGSMVTLSLQLTEIIHLGPLPEIDLELIYGTALVYVKWMVPSVLLTLVGSYVMHR